MRHGGVGDLGAVPSSANGGEQFRSKRTPRSLFSRVQMVKTCSRTAGGLGIQDGTFPCCLSSNKPGNVS